MENRKEWLRARKNYIGGSALGAICGLNAYRTPLDVYLDKVEGKEVAENENNAPMRWGTLLEDAIAKAYSEDTGLTVSEEPNVLYHEKYPFLGANIDRWVGDIDRDLIPELIPQTNHNYIKQTYGISYPSKFLENNRVLAGGEYPHAGGYKHTK